MNACRISRKCTRGFTATELLVLLGIVVILLSIFIPYIFRNREASNRIRCSDHLRAIGLALSAYARFNGGSYPSVVHDTGIRPNGYVAFTGPDAHDPFAKDSAVRPNDVTASLWLLVRSGLLGSDYSPPTAVFVCPSTSDKPDPLVDAEGREAKPSQRGNFRNGKHLSYSYCTPFSSAPGFRLTDTQKPRFAILADKNPGMKRRGSDVTRPPSTATAFDIAMANSNNHGRVGQNVLYADMHVSFEKTPYCGEGGDNIYTALAPAPLTARPSQFDAKGVCGPLYGPAWDTDSYLVPTEDEMTAAAFPPPPRKPATAPVTTSPTPATAPGTQSSSAP